MVSHYVHTSLSIIKFITSLFLSAASGYIINQILKQVCEVGTKVRQMLERTATGFSWIAITHILFQASGVAMTLVSSSFSSRSLALFTPLGPTGDRRFPSRKPVLFQSHMWTLRKAGSSTTIGVGTVYAPPAGEGPTTGRWRPMPGTAWTPIAPPS